MNEITWVFVGIIIGCVLMGLIFIWDAIHDDGVFSRGWDCGYKYGKKEQKDSK